MKINATLKHLAFLCLWLTSLSGMARADGQHHYTNEMIDAAMAATCDHSLVLLGENTHGDGTTLAFKTEMVERLVNECGFDTVLFEAGIYDFLALNMITAKSEPVTREMVSSSIGWIRSRFEETQPLINTLYEAQENGLYLGGLDDQLGSHGAFYSLEQLPIDLAAFLPVADRHQCQQMMRARIWYDYPEGVPYNEANKKELLTCLNQIEQTLNHQSGSRGNNFSAMTAAFRRMLSRDFIDQNTYVAARDGSMFKAFKTLALNRLTEGHKVIVWSTNSHIARRADGIAGYKHGPNLGELIAHMHGDKLYALGFTASGGSFLWGREDRPVPSGADHSLEAFAYSATNGIAGFIDTANLHKFGEGQGSLFNHQAESRKWRDLFDGIVVFETEQPPTPTQR